MQKWLEGKPMAPIRIDAELHTRCNSRCIMCARRVSVYPNLTERQRRKMEMPPRKWIRIAEESGKMGVRMWNISGLCEPVYRPDILFPTMRMIKAYDVFGELTTNGMLWKEKYVRETVEMGWDSVCVSIDAPAEIHDKLRGVRGAYRRATHTLKLFKKIRDEMKTNLPVLTINIVLNNLTYNKLDRMVRLAHELGIDAIFAEPMVVFSPQAEKLRLNKKQIAEFKQIVEGCKELARDLGILLDVTPISPSKKFEGELLEKAGSLKTRLIEDAKSFDDPILSIPCYYPWFFLMIRANGSVAHCGEWKEMEESIKGKTLAEIWFGKALSKIRADFRRGLLADCCEKCRPNVIEDMRVVRKSIIEFRDINFLRDKYFEFLEENKRLKQELFSLKRRGYPGAEKCIKCRYRKELTKFQSSITYRLFSRFWETKLEKLIKKLWPL
jgi:MoaA/NifB/PqqE/SkfB family radical SAM enzyme